MAGVRAVILIHTEDMGQGKPGSDGFLPFQSIRNISRSFGWAPVSGSISRSSTSCI